MKETHAEAQIGNVVPAPPPPPGSKPDPDTLNMGGVDASFVVTSLGNNRFELTVQNTSRVGYIDKFDWQPPNGDTIQSVGDSSRGSCGLDGDQITCGGVHLKPPDCLCHPGGTMTVTFTMRQPDPQSGLASSGLEILNMTPVLQNIPSSPGEASRHQT